MNAPGNALRPGRRLGDARILGHLARSNVLDVYDAWSELRGSRVILKTLRPDRLRDEAARAALLREGELLTRLAHPHLVRAFAVVEEPRPTVVLETLRGETLAALIERRGHRRLEADAIAHLGAHLASVLGYLHRSGILHLDVKPSNIVAEGGRAKLIDLSVARAPGPAKAGIGTWMYLAPEQARGDDLQPAADVFGLGGVLFEAATGVRAFDHPGIDDDLEYPQLHLRAPAVRSLRPRLPRDLATVIDAALAPDPASRPALADIATVATARVGLSAG